MSELSSIISATRSRSASGRPAREKGVAAALTALIVLAQRANDALCLSVALRAADALARAPGKTEHERLRALAAIPVPPSAPSTFSVDNALLTLLIDFTYALDASAAARGACEELEALMSMAARNPDLADAAARIAAELAEDYVTRLSEPALSIPAFEAIVEEMLVDPRLAAAEQKVIVHRVTGAPPRRLGNLQNRRNELRSWRRARENADWMFHAHAHEKRRF